MSLLLSKLFFGFIRIDSKIIYSFILNFIISLISDTIASIKFSLKSEKKEFTIVIN